MTTPVFAAGPLAVNARVAADLAPILTPEALRFIEALVLDFAPRRDALLAARRERQKRITAGERPEFLSDTAPVRDSDWLVAPIPPDLADRRVEITGPVDRKMIINALNSGASVFMADFEDSTSPTWENVLRGQLNLRDAVRRTITFRSKDGKTYRLNEQTAVLMVRPRGWHLDERHVTLSGRPIPAALFDFGLYCFHNARTLVANGTAPYYYLPKLENHFEARLWNDVFVRAQELLGIPVGTIRATVLIETILAAFEMDEILFELRDHSGGLNCGRWDYIFSLIKTFAGDPAFTLPDRADVTMATPFMRAYSQLTIRTCHRRGIHAMGGMAAQIPIKEDPAANEAALAKVRADKEREVGDGHDGTWVAHPGLVGLAREIFDRGMPGPNQIHRMRKDVEVTAAQLLEVPQGRITHQGLRQNLDIAVRYMASWLGGNGCVPIYNLMEDAATAEISRSQVWQWLHHPNGVLDDGRRVTPELVDDVLTEQLAWLRRERGEASFTRGGFERAARIIRDIVMADEFLPFMTSIAYTELD